MQLHRLPNRKSGQDRDNASQNHPAIKKPLHGVIDRQIVVREPARKRRPCVGCGLAKRDRQQLAFEPAGDKAVGYIGEPACHQHPHGSEMPLRRAAKPAAKRQHARRFEGQGRIGVVNLQAAHDHHNDRNRIDPMRDTDDQRVDEWLAGVRVRRQKNDGRHGHDEDLTAAAGPHQFLEWSSPVRVISFSAEAPYRQRE